MILKIKRYQSTKHTNTQSFKHTSFLVYAKKGHHQCKYTEGQISVAADIYMPVEIVDCQLYNYTLGKFMSIV